MCVCVGSLVVKGCRSGALAAPQWSVAVASAGREWLKLDQGWQINIDEYQRKVCPKISVIVQNIDNLAGYSHELEAISISMRILTGITNSALSNIDISIICKLDYAIKHACIQKPNRAHFQLHCVVGIVASFWARNVASW